MFQNLELKDTFARRHNSIGAAELPQMLHTIGVDSLAQLINETIPTAIRTEKPMNLPEPLTEPEMLAHMRALEQQNRILKSYIGIGYHDTHVPTVIQRNIFENPGWYTQYTPYQAEIAQGRMEALLNFQTLVCDLTGLPISNASLLDEGTAAAEAMTMFHHVTREKNLGDKFLVDAGVHPQTLGVLHTRANPLGIEIVVGDLNEIKPSTEFFGALVQFPATDGKLFHYGDFVNSVHAYGGLVVVAADLLSLTLLTPPGEFGADVAVGSAQRFGVPMGYGGPHPAYFATREDFKRHIPGRLIGLSIDSQNQPALRLALQTREQHIRREKATSNICTAQVLLAVMASMYAVYHGPEGLKNIARRVHFYTRVLAAALDKLGFYLLHEEYFDTLRFHLGEHGQLRSNIVKSRAEAAGYNFRYYSDETIGIALDETTTMADIEAVVGILASAVNAPQVPNLASIAEAITETYPDGLVRTSSYLTHPTFNSYHTEHEMLRYIRRLESRDLSLTTSMIPLGSCTMKLNASTEMYPVTFPGFSLLHPFVPTEQAAGYLTIFRELEDYLCQATGFAGVSLQPNSGAQGEYAGLMVIREYLQAQGQGHRNVALIPSSAHGTNPASAVMAGMQVVVVKTDEQGNIDMADLLARADQYKDTLAALMVTYPSTHGVFESAIREATAIIHERGGQVYMDGANMNAQVGLTSPGLIGADVCHLNLHKTFCIPHGGGGPGMGPICVAKHLVPYLPAHPLVDLGRPHGMTPVSAAPYGSASILLISYAYIRMMGTEGLTNATRYAILNANYIKARLEPHYPVLYKGTNGRVAHELIIDMRGFKATANIEVEDVAKRLIDYGYHAPTVSFPVPGTMMIEPTESESLHELDRFCEAMIQIRAEIETIISGKADKENNVLKHAPHTAAVVMADEWNRPYTRAEAAYPAAWLRDHKFWPSVGRVNNGYGDRHLICTCPPIEEYAN
jgi:glycine dehydrogenase